MRTTNTKPTKAEFEAYLKLAIDGGIVSDTGLNDSITQVLNQIVFEGPSPKLIQQARDLFNK